MREWPFIILLAGSLLGGCDKPVERVNSPSIVAKPELAESCDERVRTANRAGFYEGVTVGRRNEKEAEAKDLGMEGGRIPIQILVEDIPGEDAYQLAAAETITTYFSRHYVIAQDARLVLDVSGTNAIDGVVEYEVSLQSNFAVNVPTGEKMNSVFGTFVLSTKAGTMRISSAGDRTQTVKAAIYSVLSKGDAKLFPNS